MVNPQWSMFNKKKWSILNGQWSIKTMVNPQCSMVNKK